MGCCNKKNRALYKIDSTMDDFFIKKINFDFVRKKINEYNNSQNKNYYEFWTLVKHCGIHLDIGYQRNYWELAYVTHSEESILGILMVLIFQCLGLPKDKILYITQFIQKDIIKSKIQEEHLIMNLEEFNKILYVYFSCMTNIYMSAIDKIYSYSKDNIPSIQEEFTKINNKFCEKNLRTYTINFLKGYVRKNFFINVGQLLEEKINFLLDEKAIRNDILNFDYENDDDVVKNNDNEEGKQEERRASNPKEDENNLLKEEKVE